MTSLLQHAQQGTKGSRCHHNAHQNQEAPADQIDDSVVPFHPAEGALPSVISGRPGKLIIDKEASYSAWNHEYTHFLDDKKDGYLGMRVFADTEKCIERERHAYGVEIQMAKQMNRPDIVKRLEELMRKEIARYADTTE